jgi:hypothetical protein
VLALNPGCRDIPLVVHAEGAEFLVVGGYATGADGVARATGDLDLRVAAVPRRP